MTKRIAVTMALLALIGSATGAAVWAAEPAPQPAAIGLSESAAKERAELFAALAAAKDEADAREVEARLWTFWRSLGNHGSQQALEISRAAQLRFAYREAITVMEAATAHQPDFAYGWNELAYVYFLAGRYDDSLRTIDRVLELEPLHYAALAGKGIILIQQDKIAEAQVPLKRALAINPWLKERRLILKDDIPQP